MSPIVVASGRMRSPAASARSMGVLAKPANSPRGGNHAGRSVQADTSERARKSAGIQTGRGGGSGDAWSLAATTLASTSPLS